MFTVQKKEIAAALGLIDDVVERRGTIPIIANVLLETDGDMLKATGSNLDQEMSVRFTPESMQDFEGVTVPSHMLWEIIKKLPDAPISFNSYGKSVIAKSGRSRFVLQSLPQEDFPSLDGGEMTASLSLDATAFADALSGVRFAISTEEMRYYLNGVYLHRLEAGRIALVATDGHRLSKRVVETDDSADFEGVILPRLAVNVIAKQLAAHDRLVLDISPSKIRVTAGNAVLVSKLIDGTFPDYDRVIPRGSPRTAVFGVEALSGAVDRVMTVSSDKSRGVKLALGDGRMVITTRNPDAGEATEDIDFTGDTDLAIETGFNGRYICDALANLGADQAEWLFEDAGSPTIIRKPGQTDDLIVLMPMRV